MRTSLAITALVVLYACKARNHDEAGLLDRADDLAVAQDAYDVHCVGLEQDAAALAYDLKITGAPAPAAQEQTLTVELVKVQGGASTVLNVDRTATGAVSETGPVSVAFTGGVLSADKAMDDKAHVGVLTVFGDVDALDVRCLVALRDPRG